MDENGQTDPPVRERIALMGMRGAIARHVVRGHAVPNTTLFTSADVSAGLELLKQLVRDWRPLRVRPQYQDLVLWALSRTLREHPLANAHLQDDELVLFDTVNLGIAVAVDGGIMVPVLCDVQDKSLLDITRETRELVKNVKRGKLNSKHLSRSTFSITSLMAYGIAHFTPILNAPEVGILGVGKIGDANGKPIGHFSLTFDHRAWDGAPAALFLSAFVERLCTLPKVNDLAPSQA